MKPTIDIDALRTEHESDEQWEVRRNFMEEHKDDFEEGELITLAQLFTNIEFLGCRCVKTFFLAMVVPRQGKGLLVLSFHSSFPRAFCCQSFS